MAREVEKGDLHDYELIFVNDASTDASEEVLRAEAAKKPDIRMLTMSRNFGIGECLMAGFAHARGDVVAYLDADLQDPPEVIADLLREYRAHPDADVVYTTRLKRLGENPLKMWLTRMGYRLFRRLYDVPLPVDSGDFKLLSRKVVNHVVSLSDKRPFIRGMISFIGFKQIPVYYVREPRRAGETRCPLFSRKVLYHSIFRGFIAYSDAPLLFPFAASMVLLGGGLALLLGMAFSRSLLPPILASIFLLGALLTFLQGVQNLYIMNLRHQDRGHPLYIIKSKFGFDHDE